MTRIQDRTPTFDRSAALRALDEAEPITLTRTPRGGGSEPRRGADVVPAGPSTGAATSRRGDLDLAGGHHQERLQGPRRRREELQVGTYNVGNANHIARRPENFERTRNFLGEKAAKGQVDVLMMQEVDRNTRRAQGHDNNVRMLQSVFEGELGPRFRDATVRTRKVDGNTWEVVARNDDGDVRRMHIDRKDYDEKGERTRARPSAISRYVATIPGRGGEEDRTYNLMYGASKPVPGGGQYGNAILMGPGFEPKRFAMRTVGRDPSDGERRTALAVEATTPQGKEVGLMSTHLTNGRDRAAAGERVDQYAALDAFGDRFFGRTPRIIGGDYNSHAARPGAHGWADPDPRSGTIDRVYTEGTVKARDREIYRNRGGSDHDLVRWDVRLR